ncbi:hypothetical protein V502_00934 [Pseudogymnoascus sp. VKM F-4520 (FW-2644)]|nr:hypothetical protein V502_00934 [Pseudogymnoascus sp. VKM F-4520 (FW-2644)]
MMCRGIVEQWESIRKAIQSWFRRESLPNAVTALINECIWVTKFKAVFDSEAILTIEEAIETVDRIGVGTLGFTQNTAPSWYPDIAKFEEAKACLWQGSAPNDESAWDQEEVRNFLKAAMGNGEPNAYIDVDMGTWLKTKIHAGSIIVSDNGRIGKMEAGRKEAGRKEARPNPQPHYINIASCMTTREDPRLGLHQFCLWRDDQRRSAPGSAAIKLGPG